MSSKSKRGKVFDVTYVKDSGESSDRQILVMSEPGVHIMALEVTGVSPATLEIVYNKVNAQKAELDKLIKELGISWKQFKPEGLTFTRELPVAE